MKCGLFIRLFEFAIQKYLKLIWNEKEMRSDRKQGEEGQQEDGLAVLLVVGGLVF